MKLTNSDKQRTAIDTLSLIYKCETLSDTEYAKSMLEELVKYGFIFKCDYYVLRNELNERIRRLTETGCY